MKSTFIPKINCRFKIRRDIHNYVGFFQGRGVLIFNDIGAFIVSTIDGKQNISKIAKALKSVFPKVKQPIKEVTTIIAQLQKAGYL